MTFVLGSTSMKNLERVHPSLVRVVKTAIGLSEIDFGVHSGARTAEEQNKLFKRGVTQMDGYNKKSNHQIKPDGVGYAVDLVPWEDKWVWDDSWEKHYIVAWAMAQAARKLSIPVRWGGNWYERLNDYGSSIAEIREAVVRYKKQHAGADFIDAPHFEYKP